MSYLPTGISVPKPLPDGLDRESFNLLARHRLAVRRCADCGTWQWPPEVICHECRGFALTWEDVAPAGYVFSWTRIWHPVRPVLRGAVPYVVVLVELPAAGNVRLIGNLLGSAGQSVRVGDSVTGVYEDHDEGFTLLQWQKSGR
jgi:uncharacterized OB-fold protein